MGTVNLLNQMAEYDFNTPIDVEMIFEDSDEDVPSLQNALDERETINDKNNNKQDKISSKNQINDRGLNKSMLSLKKNNRILKKNPIKEISGNNLKNCKNAEIRNITNYVGHYHNQNEFDSNQNAVVLIDDDTVINNEESLSSPRQRNDHHESVTMFIEDLLNKLSEHIVLIMQSFYHYGVKKTNEGNRKREEIFNFIKSHFFELSYTTVESIFLPQEQNESFINQFLDNTVLLANSKSLQWKCHKGHVLPFFKELLTWTKQKREYIKNNRIQCGSNENIMLKQQLIRPLLPMNFPQSEIVANSNIATQKTQNNLCIFTSGTPGNEISINIDADTLIQTNERQQCITAEQNLNHNNVATICEATRRKPPVARPKYGNRVKDIQKKNPKYDRPPPPYDANHSSKNLLSMPPRYNQTNLNTNYRYNNMRQPHQNHQNIEQTISSYPTQVHYINTNQTSPSDNNNVNCMFYDNTNTSTNIPMHETQMENDVTSSPVITNVSSLNPKTRILYVRCYMCGKTTSAPYDQYNHRRTPIYCSYLCKELDSQFYKQSAWSTT